MLEVTGQMLQVLSTKLQTSDKKPNAKIKLETKDGREFEFDKIISLDLDRRMDSIAGFNEPTTTNQCAELSVTIPNPVGYYSPDYSTKKFPELNLTPSPYGHVFWPDTKIQAFLGYGKNLRLVFTGFVDKVKIKTPPSTLTIRARDVYSLIMEHVIEPPAPDYIYTYENWAMADMIADLIRKEIPNIGVRYDQILVKDLQLGQFTEYMIANAVFKYGMILSDAIERYIKYTNHRVGASRDGDIIIKQIILKTQEDPEDWTYSDWVSLRDIDYDINKDYVRTHYRVVGSNGINTFKCPYFVNLSRQRRLAREIIPWADTYEKRKIATQAYFGRLMRKFRTASFGVIGNPNLELEDLVKFKNVDSTATGKYQVIGIRTSFSTAGYFDIIDVDYGVDLVYVEDEGFSFDPYVPDVPGPESATATIKEEILFEELFHNPELE